MVTLVQREKNSLRVLWAVTAGRVRPQNANKYAACPAAIPESGWSWRFVASIAGPAARCSSWIGGPSRRWPAVEGRADQACRHAQAEGHRHRRDPDSPGPQLSHRGQRPDPQTADLATARSTASAVPARKTRTGQRGQRLSIEIHDHSPRMTAQAHLSLESRWLLQAHVSLEEPDYVRALEAMSY